MGPCRGASLPRVAPNLAQALAGPHLPPMLLLAALALIGLVLADLQAVARHRE